jgi:3-oxoacyl-[acyl-carrier-protein] synthase I
MAYCSGDNIITSLGSTTQEVLSKIEHGITGINDTVRFRHLTKAPVSLIDYDLVEAELSSIFPDTSFTRFEGVISLSIYKALQNNAVEPGNNRTLLILSSTKGNIELLNRNEKHFKNLLLHHTAQKIACLFNFSNQPVVICNACISGVLALIMAKRYIDSGKYDTIVVAGADVATDFVVAGFESFKSMSEQPCKPFDSTRDGLSLGEGAATMIVTREPGKSRIKIMGGSSANDANHISGPSRTGEGLFIATANTIGNIKDIDFISAHGTATPYNDDMESIAIQRLGLDHVPVNSFKGYIGHTLGAAGIIETILTVQSMTNGIIYKTLGNENPGVVSPINITTQNIQGQFKRCLKMSSGFGGCNASILLEKDDE